MPSVLKWVRCPGLGVILKEKQNRFSGNPPTNGSSLASSAGKRTTCMLSNWSENYFHKSNSRINNEKEQAKAVVEGLTGMAQLEKLALHSHCMHSKLKELQVRPYVFILLPPINVITIVSGIFCEQGLALFFK